MNNDLRQQFKFPVGGGAANETSPPEIVAFLREKGVQIDGTFEATVSLYGRLHSSLSFRKIGDYTAPTIVKLDVAYYDVQVVIGGYVSGTVVAWFAGFVSS